MLFPSVKSSLKTNTVRSYFFSSDSLMNKKNAYRPLCTLQYDVPLIQNSDYKHLNF